jgi:hypothetical protein
LLDLRDARDRDIFMAARRAAAAIVTKDADSCVWSRSYRRSTAEREGVSDPPVVGQFQRVKLSGLGVVAPSRDAGRLSTQMTQMAADARR